MMIIADLTATTTMPQEGSVSVLCGTVSRSDHHVNIQKLVSNHPERDFSIKKYSYLVE